MRSTDPGSSGSPDGGIPDDRTTRARIRDAAITCFAEAGIAGSTVRSIARAAGVSPGLVMHHFGSKENLLTACDRHTVALVLSIKSEAIAQGHDMDLLTIFRSYRSGPPLARYVARRLVDGSGGVDDLVDELVDSAAAQMAEAARTGMVRPTDDPRGRAAVLLLWSLGSLVLHEHVTRLLGADLMGELDDMTSYLRPLLEVYGQGVLTEESYAALLGQLPAPAESPGGTAPAAEPATDEKG